MLMYLYLPTYLWSKQIDATSIFIYVRNMYMYTNTYLPTYDLSFFCHKEKNFEHHR